MGGWSAAGRSAEAGRRTGLAADSSGATIVEFAFLAPVLLLLLGTIETARFLLARSALESAIAVTIRQAMIEPASRRSVCGLFSTKTPPGSIPPASPA